MSKLVLDEKEIIRLYTEELLSIEDIRKKFNVNFGTIKLRLLNNNIQLRSSSESKKIVMNKPEVKKRTRDASKRSSKQRIQTTIERYGVSVASNNPEIRKTWEKEYVKEHGIEWNKDPHRLEKIEKTNLIKRGVINVSQDPDIKKLIQENRWLNKTEHELQKIQEKSNDTFFKNNSLDKIHLILDYCGLELLEEFKGMLKKHKYKCKKCGNVFKLTFNTIKQGNKCQICYPRNIQRVSVLEKELVEFIKTITTNIVENSRQIIPPQELDIYLPDYNLAIEFNGLWYHSEEGPNSITSKYHLNKTIECEKMGIRLIHLFEDEWVYKKDIVKYRLKQILGVSTSIRIHARKCKIKEITKNEKDIFLNKFHIQGKDISRIKLGAFYNDELVSVMTFSKGNISKGSKPKEGEWELNRFSSNYNYHIPGIAGKLLMYFKRNYEWIKIFSYADRRWSDGNLYRKLNFNEVYKTKPNYWYIKGLHRIYRYDLKKREDEPKNIPEWTLRQSEGYCKIWDCGNLKFEMNKTLS